MAQSEQKSESLNLKAFNTTGNDDTTAEVLRPQASPEAKKRSAALIGLVTVALFVLLYVAYQRSGLDLIPSADDHKSIGQSASQAEQDRKVE